MFTSLLTALLSLSINVVESTSLLFITEEKLGSSFFFVIKTSLIGVHFSLCSNTFLLSGDPDFLTIGFSSGGSLSL